MKLAAKSGLLVTVCALALAACQAGPDYSRPDVKVAQTFASDPNIKAAPMLPTTPWWTAFNDAVLNKLIDKAIQQNLTVAGAMERVTQARAAAQQSNASAFPQINAKEGYTFQKSAYSPASTAIDPYQTWSGSLSASWEIDLFGKYRRTAEASAAQVEASQEEANGAWLTLISDVSQAYVEARGYQTRIRLAKSTLSSRNSNLSAIRTKVQVGGASELDAAKAEGEAATSAADLQQLDIQYHTIAFKLAVLLAEDPQSVLDLLADDKPVPVAKMPFGAGIPADLLRNRPDVRAAERYLAVATAKIGVAEANLYPSLSIAGMIGAAAGSVANLGTRAADNWSVGPAINLPIFDAGARRAQVDIMQSLTRQQALNYRMAVLQGVQEVENALASYTREAKRREALARSVAAYGRAASVARQFYTSGAVGYMDVLDAERALYSAQDALATSTQTAATDYIALCKALGGGWQKAEESVMTKAAEGENVAPSERENTGNHGSSGNSMGGG